MCTRTMKNELTHVHVAKTNLVYSITITIISHKYSPCKARTLYESPIENYACYTRRYDFFHWTYHRADKSETNTTIVIDSVFAP